MDGDGHKFSDKSVDFRKLSPLERQRVRDIWLAAPRAPSPLVREIPTLVRKTPFGLSVPALKAKCSPHTELLAIAKSALPQMHYVTKAEREAQKDLEEEMTKEELRWLKRKFFPVVSTGVNKSALTARTTPRIEAMALARLRQSEVNYGSSEKRNKRKRTLPSHFPLPEKCRLPKKKSPRVCGCARNFLDKQDTLNQSQRNAVNRHIKEHYEIFRSNYPPEADKIYVIAGGAVVHATCSGKASGKKKRGRFICELNKNQRKMFRKRMKLLGLPKKLILPDKGPERGPKKKIKDFEPWLTMMSQPRYNILMEKPYNPFKVRSLAKLYVPTERILIMAKPREPPQPPPLLDFEGNELPPRREWSYNSRRRIVASARTLELATPKFVKKKAADDVKEDPFAVPRRALTAFCTQRTRELAEPRQR